MNTTKLISITTENSYLVVENLLTGCHNILSWLDMVRIANNFAFKSDYLKALTSPVGDDGSAKLLTSFDADDLICTAFRTARLQH